MSAVFVMGFSRGNRRTIAFADSAPSGLARRVPGPMVHCTIHSPRASEVHLKVTVVGTGYVGLVTGACLSEMGNHVVCLDVDADKIRVLNDGGIPIHEPGLKEIVQRNVRAGRLQFTTDFAAAVAHGTMQFIGVGTPPDED